MSTTSEFPACPSSRFLKLNQLKYFELGNPDYKLSAPVTNVV